MIGIVPFCVMFMFSDLEKMNERSNASLLEKLIRSEKKSYWIPMSEPVSLRSSVRVLGDRCACMAVDICAFSHLSCMDFMGTESRSFTTDSAYRDPHLSGKCSPSAERRSPEREDTSCEFPYTCTVLWE